MKFPDALFRFGLGKSLNSCALTGFTCTLIGLPFLSVKLPAISAGVGTFVMRVMPARRRNAS